MTTTTCHCRSVSRPPATGVHLGARGVWLACGALVVLAATSLAQALGRVSKYRRVGVRLQEQQPAGASFLPAPAGGRHLSVSDSGASGYEALLPITFYNINTKQSATVSLYDNHGNAREASLSELSELLGDSRRKGEHWVFPIEPRLLKVVFRAAYHFRRQTVEVISGYRRPSRRREGHHAEGLAIDLRIPGVEASVLAAYFRSIPRLGIGWYTHPKTKFVHVDVRDVSFHWLDHSPPRRRYREVALRTLRLRELDASYSAKSDLPEDVESFVGP